MTLPPNQLVSEVTDSQLTVAVSEIISWQRTGLLQGSIVRGIADRLLAAGSSEDNILPYVETLVMREAAVRFMQRQEALEAPVPVGNLSVYTVRACRWGDTETHSYLVGVYAQESDALSAAQNEEEYRGGKYECEVLEWPKPSVPATTTDPGYRVVKPLPPARTNSSKTGQLTPHRFHVLATLLRSPELVKKAAWIVLVEGGTVTDAVSATGLLQPSVSRTIKRYLEKHALIQEGY